MFLKKILSFCCLFTTLFADDVDQLIKNQTQFSFSLYPTLEEPETNLIFSPYGIATCLSMAYLGARGETEAQMREALHLTVDRKNIAKASLALSQLLQPECKENSYQLHAANGVWVAQNLFLLTDFRYAIESQFKAKLEGLNFASPETAVTTMNQWTCDQTKGHICQLLETKDLNSLTRLVLTSALYLQGNWRFPFDPKATHDWPFYPTTETSVTAKMMQQTLFLPYFENELIQAVGLPLVGASQGGAGGVGVYLLLPKSAENFDAMVEELAENFDKWLSSSLQKRVCLMIPKCTISSRFELQHALERLGMQDAFDADANFTGIDGMRDLSLNKVIAEAFLSIDEQGMTAAAATAVAIGMKSTPPNQATPPIPFVADHPFLIFVVDPKSHAILFMGKVANPS